MNYIATGAGFLPSTVCWCKNPILSPTDFGMKEPLFCLLHLRRGSWWKHRTLVSTPLEISMEHNHGSLEDHVLSKRVISRFVNLPGCTAWIFLQYVVYISLHHYSNIFVIIINHHVSPCVTTLHLPWCFLSPNHFLRKKSQVMFAAATGRLQATLRLPEGTQVVSTEMPMKVPEGWQNPQQIPLQPRLACKIIPTTFGKSPRNCWEI